MYSAKEIEELNAKNIEYPDGSMHIFDFQLLRIPDHGCTVRCGGKNRDDRDFIDQGRDPEAIKYGLCSKIITSLDEII